MHPWVRDSKDQLTLVSNFFFKFVPVLDFRSNKCRKLFITSTMLLLCGCKGKLKPSLPGREPIH
jgi:hypothetical protein